MGKLLPINDYFMVELETGKWAGTPGSEDGIRTGRVVALSADMPFFGFNTFMFDSSLMNDPLLAEIRERYKKYIGKKVWWPERTESGSIVPASQSPDGKEYAFLKLTAIMAVEED